MMPITKQNILAASKLPYLVKVLWLWATTGWVKPEPLFFPRKKLLKNVVSVFVFSRNNWAQYKILQLVVTISSILRNYIFSNFGVKSQIIQYLVKLSPAENKTKKMDPTCIVFSGRKMGGLRFFPTCSCSVNTYLRKILEFWCNNCIITGKGRSKPDRQFFYVNSRPCELPSGSKSVNEIYHQFNR